jgi:hypothetical protein
MPTRITYLGSMPQYRAPEPRLPRHDKLEIASPANEQQGVTPHTGVRSEVVSLRRFGETCNARTVSFIGLTLQRKLQRQGRATKSRAAWRLPRLTCLGGSELQAP